MQDNNGLIALELTIGESMMNDQLKQLESAIANMRLGKVGGRNKPHKSLMLLVVLDLFDANLIEDNRISYNQDLVERFQQYFEAVKKEGDWCQPGMPFFHLRSSSFWKHHVIPGREERYSELQTSGGGSKRILDNIQYAYLDKNAFVIFSDPNQRQELRGFILTTFFAPDDHAALRAVIEAESDISAYESALVGQAPLVEEIKPAVRSAAFRRVVLRSYDYQCAVCGLRIVLPDIPSPVDAAHLVPWSESHDDSPNNGMALCKLHHWALDASLISPTLDMQWRVSQLLDARRNSEHELTRFDGLPMLLPRKEKFYPDLDAIQWRLARLTR